MNFSLASDLISSYFNFVRNWIISLFLCTWLYYDILYMRLEYLWTLLSAGDLGNNFPKISKLHAFEAI